MVARVVRYAVLEIFEGPGLEGRGASLADITIARELRAVGLKARGRRKAAKR